MSSLPIPSSQPASPGPDVRVWRNTLFFIFALPGFAAATWVSRTADVRDLLGASTGQMGLVVFFLAIGSLVGLTAASHSIARFGGRVSVLISSSIAMAGLLLACLGLVAKSLVLFDAGFAVFGCGFGMLDVTMNVEGGAAEQAYGKTFMPALHAAYSAGTLAGALVGSLAVTVRLPVLAHFAGTAVVFGVSLWLLSRFLPAATGRESPNSGEEEMGLSAKERFAVWREPRVLLIGLVVLGAGFAEGAANDWIPLAMVDGYGTHAAIGSLTYGVFVAAMTAARLAGGWFLDRFGRVAVLRSCAVLAVAGLVLFIFGGRVELAMAGALLWGLGASVGFPVGMSAAGDDPRGASARVGAVATMGYASALAGPPGIGFLAEHTGLLYALLPVLVLVAMSGLLSHAARPLGAGAASAAPAGAGPEPTARVAE